MRTGRGERRGGVGDLGYDDKEEDEERQETVESTQPAKKDKKRGHTCARLTCRNRSKRRLEKNLSSQPKHF